MWDNGMRMRGWVRMSSSRVREKKYGKKLNVEEGRM